MSESGPQQGWSTGDGAPLPPPPLGGGVPTDPYGGSAYGSPPPVYGSPGYATPAASGTNGMAIASISCSLGGIVLGALTCGILAPAIIVGIVLGHVALSQIKRTGQDGRGLALTGVIAGYSSIGLFILVIVLAVAFGDSSST